MLRKSVVINRPQGLGARPIAELVQVASKYESRVYLEHGRRKVNAKSIMGMMSLGLSQDAEVTVSAEGEDEQDAVEGIVSYLKNVG